MSRLRLLERLNRREHERNRRRRDDSEAIQESVRHHICQILRTRAGNVPIDEGFGLGAVARPSDGDGSSGSDDGVAEAVRQAISRYESRVRDIEVTSRGLGAHRLGLELDISAVIKDEQRPTTVRVSGALLMGGLFVANRG